MNQNQIEFSRSLGQQQVLSVVKLLRPEPPVKRLAILQEVKLENLGLDSDQQLADAQGQFDLELLEARYRVLVDEDI